MSAELRQLLRDFAANPREEETIHGLIQLRVGEVDLEDEFFESFPRVQRSRIYTALSLCAMPAALETLQRRLSVEEDRLCRAALTVGIAAGTSPAKAAEVGLAPLFRIPQRTEAFRRALREGIRRHARDPEDREIFERVKSMGLTDWDFRSALWDGLAVSERVAVYEALLEWCGPLYARRILDRRLEKEEDGACREKIEEVLKSFQSEKGMRRFNWRPEE